MGISFSQVRQIKGAGTMLDTSYETFIDSWTDLIPFLKEYKRIAISNSKYYGISSKVSKRYIIKNMGEFGHIDCFEREMQFWFEVNYFVEKIWLNALGQIVVEIAYKDYRPINITNEYERYKNI
jgi:hypothetical protein